MAALGGVSPDYHVVLHVSTKTSGLVARNVVFVTILATQTLRKKAMGGGRKAACGQQRHVREVHNTNTDLCVTFDL